MSSHVSPGWKADGSSASREATPPDGMPLYERPAETGARVDRMLEALLMWLKWNDAYERSTTTLFDQRDNPRLAEDLMDQMDQLRRQVAELSRDLLDKPPG